MFSKMKKAAKPQLPPTVESASEGSPGYVRDFAVGSLRERRLLMSLRVVSMGLFASICLCVALSFLLISLMPLKEVRPFLVQVVDGGTVAASIRPIQDTFEAKDLLTEKLVREYVVNRHEILRSDPVMQNRWSKTGYMGVTTENPEYQRFTGSVMATLDQIRASGAERRARIVNVSAVTLGQVYLVDFVSEFYDQRGNRIDSREYTATIEIDFKPLAALTKEQMLINPTGFTVVNYSLSEKDQ